VVDELAMEKFFFGLAPLIIIIIIIIPPLIHKHPSPPYEMCT
jgi:hypothetical protein